MILESETAQDRSTAPKEDKRVEEKKEAGKKLCLAYLTTEYPKVSHTFIRREIQNLEERGHSVLRMAIRGSGGNIADPEDKKEEGKTFHCLERPKGELLGALTSTALLKPFRFIKALAKTFQMHRKSTRGLFRHFAYLVEACRLLKLVEEEGIDHIHVHFGTNSTTVARLMRALGGPTYSFTVHGPDEFDDPKGYSLKEKIADSRFVVAITSFCRSQLQRWSDYKDWSKIKIVHCTVADEFFEKHTPIEKGTKTLVCVGRLSAQKGQLLLLDALAKVREKGHDVNLVLAGDGEMREIIEKHINDMNLAGHVKITGWIGEAEVRKHLIESRGLVLPSSAEGLPVVIMEALAMGRPVISTAIAGIPELVKDKENGWLITAGDLEGLTKAMEEIVTTPTAKLDEMGLNGRRLIQEHHKGSTEAEKLERYFLA